MRELNRLLETKTNFMSSVRDRTNDINIRRLKIADNYCRYDRAHETATCMAEKSTITARRKRTNCKKAYKLDRECMAIFYAGKRMQHEGLMLHPRFLSHHFLGLPTDLLPSDLYIHARLAFFLNILAISLYTCLSYRSYRRYPFIT